MYKPVTCDYFDCLQPYFSGENYRLCVYSLPSLLVWNGCLGEIAFSEREGLLLLADRVFDNTAGRRLLMPFYRPFREPAAGELAELLKEEGLSTVHFVPGSYVEKRASELAGLFTLSEQAGFMDYIYRASDLAGLQGRAYAKKRNLVSQFRREYGSRSTVELINSENGQRCLEVLESWAADRDKTHMPEMLACEKKAIKASLAGFGQLGLRGIMVLIDGEVKGFALGSPLSADTFVLNFEKAVDGFKGLYQYLDMEFARSLPEKFSFINKESDLGNPGLAKSKESYYPVLREKSFELTLKD